MSVMTRKTAFRQELLKQVLHIPGGSKDYRRYLERTALVIVDDLSRLGLLPVELKYLDYQRIAKLVYLWKDEVSPKTVANRLSVLRSIANIANPPLFAAPSNQTFNIKLPKNHTVLTDASVKLTPSNIQNLDVQRICLLQYLFGLKKIEAIRSFELLITPDALIIPRKISFNKIERRITIINTEQRNLLETLKHYPLSNCSKALSLLHHHELSKLNIKDNEYFRLLYIVNRYNRQRELGVSKKEALKQVKQEAGYTSLRQIKGVLLCLEDS